MDGKTDVALTREFRLAGMDAHPNANRSAARPALLSERTLALRRRENGVLRPLERDEERVALVVDLDATIGLERPPKEAVMLGQQGRVVATQRLEQASRALDVGEQKRRRGRGRLIHLLIISRPGIAFQLHDLEPRGAGPEDRRSTEVEVEAVDVDANPHDRPRLLVRSDGTTFLRDGTQCDAASRSPRAPRVRTPCAAFLDQGRRKTLREVASK
jgi:hypothetical protein